MTGWGGTEIILKFNRGWVEVWVAAAAGLIGRESATAGGGNAQFGRMGVVACDGVGQCLPGGDAGGLSLNQPARCGQPSANHYEH